MSVLLGRSARCGYKLMQYMEWRKPYIFCVFRESQVEPIASYYGLELMVESNGAWVGGIIRGVIRGVFIEYRVRTA